MAGQSRYGSGSIRSKGEGRWELRVSAGRDPVTGRGRSVIRSVRGSKREAEAALAGLLLEVRQGRSDHHGTDATIKVLVEQWLDLRRDTLSVTTYEGYVAKARHRLLPALGEVSVRKLTVRDIDVFYRVLARDLGLAGSTVRQVHNVLTGVASATPVPQPPSTSTPTSSPASDRAAADAMGEILTLPAREPTPADASHLQTEAE